eukprot:CAMPEP_0170598596 /NCGR_PEP_ID=MMETSP0224-20130122/16335_1 /TAXON_ID=285029 /ORGANISM="Togula jolla, Strain CCCM 725" /LENGTH=446 /DNA_ID=CAMNT_0010923165 /DNA_START=1 /DNA_END=1342 /DNA_ORIENTATION=-
MDSGQKKFTSSKNGLPLRSRQNSRESSWGLPELDHPPEALPSTTPVRLLKMSDEVIDDLGSPKAHASKLASCDSERTASTASWTGSLELLQLTEESPTSTASTEAASSLHRQPVLSESSCPLRACRDGAEAAAMQADGSDVESIPQFISAGNVHEGFESELSRTTSIWNSWMTASKNLGRSCSNILGKRLLNDSCKPIFIFDWDDTLSPTTFLELAVMPSLSSNGRASCNVSQTLDSLNEDSPYYIRLKEHAVIVESILREAASLGHVAIVTLASVQWFDISAKAFFPGLDIQALLEELNISVHFGERTRKRTSCRIDARTIAKTNAMLTVLTASNYPVSKWNVLSIGDSVTERTALKRCFAKSRGRFSFSSQLCKTVKLKAYPTIQELSYELLSLEKHLERLIKCDKGFDHITLCRGNTVEFSPVPRCFRREPDDRNKGGRKVVL